MEPLGSFQESQNNHPQHRHALGSYLESSRLLLHDFYRFGSHIAIHRETRVRKYYNRQPINDVERNDRQVFERVQVQSTKLVKRFTIKYLGVGLIIGWKDKHRSCSQRLEVQYRGQSPGL